MPPKKRPKAFAATVIHPGLAIYQYDRSPYYYARIWDPSSKRYIVRSTQTSSKIEAKRLAIELWRTLLGGGQIVRVQTDKTFKHWARAFLNYQQGLVTKGSYAASSHTNEVTHLFSPDQGIVKALGHKELSTLKERDILGFFKKKDETREPPLTASTRNKYLNIFKKVLKHAHDEGALENVPPIKHQSNQVADNPRPSFKFFPVVTAGQDEYRKLLLAIRKARDAGVVVRGTPITQDLYDLVVFLVHSFVRPTISELYSLRFKDITVRKDLECLQIEILKGKTGYRIVSSTQKALEIFERIKARQPDAKDDDYLFLPQYPNRGHARRVAMNQFNYVLDQIGLKKDAYGQVRSLYSLRHLAIQMRLVNSGGQVNLFFLAKNCGTSVQMIERFYCRYLPMDKKVIENLQSFNR
jgi:integrase